MTRSLNCIVIAALLSACAAAGEREVGNTRDVGPTRDIGGSDVPVAPDVGRDGGDDTGVVGDTTTDTDIADASGDTVSDTAADTPIEDVQDDSVADTAPDIVPDTGPEVCEAITAVAENTFAPVDIVWAIDTSGSMDEEIDNVETNIAAFVDFIEASGLDYHVVMIAAQNPNISDTRYDVCVPQPLSGTQGCPDTDSAVYRHVREFVFSDEGIEDMIGTWGQYSDFIRPNSSLHFVAVTDDESDKGAQWFIDRAATHGYTTGDYTVHSIVSLTEREVCDFGFICEWVGCSGPYGDAEAKGEKYINLSQQTGGITASICDADWGSIFDAIAEEIVAGAEIPCVFSIPEPEEGFELVPGEVNVYFTPDGAPDGYLVPNVANDTMCGSSQAWFYDNAADPGAIHLCPSTCGAAAAGVVDIAFGCETVKI